jgi:hypothetical protein
LQTIGVPGSERLVGAASTARDPSGPGWDVERVEMPVELGACARGAEQRVVALDLDFKPPDLRSGHRIGLRSERLGQQLTPEADSQHRSSPFVRAPKKAEDVREVGMLGLVVRSHRASENDHAVGVVEQLLSRRIEPRVHPRRSNAALLEQFTESSRMAAFLVEYGDDPHHPTPAVAFPRRRITAGRSPTERR